ncbi:RNA polymerase II-associated 1 [Lecanosticta acicola]|uniref:RNA polymerase II-associated 1 n=1 Tax=Lecanosticta acicola TaxID=111012 RepID=A0AAI9E7G0_9PEZI|nr:RNA polymerase II-associated 1 [Lecanosticta acicola]
MPCFKGLAVSIHTPNGPIAEHSVQKQSRQNRISTYIPVPPAKVPEGSTTGKPEQSTFAISITLLTPGLNVPYSTPKPTPEDPNPKPRVVGGLPGNLSDRGKYDAAIPPYVPRTTNPNETIAAYIYFDGRAKEEVATLLRRGEETWVNSRWVSVPESEGGGLAEREFLFREVGLERWLNGLDLQGSNKDKAERIERRQRRLEKKRRKKKDELDDSDDEDSKEPKRLDRNGVLRYGGEDGSPVEDLPTEEGLFSSDSDSDDEPPQPEAAGQIKVALFRVLASGEIKRGEYSPQFDAHDDDEMENGGGDGADGDVDHTTSFAKPKTLDPKTISTQTVTGLDPPESPYAVFTFFYRGEKQLRKMGIISNPEAQKTPQSSRRKSSGPDFSNLGPLKSTGTVGFSGYRDSSNTKRKNQKNRDGDAMDSDADEDDDERLPNGEEEGDSKQENGSSMLSPEDAKRTGEISEGVQKIKLKRQHSSDAITENPTRKSPFMKTDDSPPVGTPQSVNSTAANAGTPPDGLSPTNLDTGDTGASPFKRQRASEPGPNSGVGFASLDSSLNETLPATSMADASVGGQRAASTPDCKREIKEDSDEEL